MNDFQENHLSMFSTVVAVMDQHMSLITPITALDSSYAAFKLLAGDINDVLLKHQLHITGVTEDKAVLKRKLASTAAIVAALTKAYAVSINDNTLKQSVNYSESDLFYSRDVTIQLDVQNIYNIANTHLAALAAYGVTPAIMTLFGTTIFDYQQKMQAPTVARDERAVATENVALLIGAANELLINQIDHSMKIFKISEPDFYKLYRKARKIIDLGGKSVNAGTLSGVVKDAATNLIVEAALIEILNSDDVASSNSLGEFSILLEPGTYSIRVSKDDYSETQVDDIVIVKGQTVSLNILLEALV